MLFFLANPGTSCVSHTTLKLVTPLLPQPPSCARITGTSLYAQLPHSYKYLPPELLRIDITLCPDSLRPQGPREQVQQAGRQTTLTTAGIQSLGHTRAISETDMSTCLLTTRESCTRSDCSFMFRVLNQYLGKGAMFIFAI